MKRVVMAYFGDRGSSEAIARQARDAEVIAMVCDLGGASALANLRDAALVAGAARCHALDLREAFAREVLLPALHAGALPDTAERLSALATPFVACKLRELAALERAECVLPAAVHMPRRRLAPPPVPPVHLDIRFDGGVPVAINGVDMPLTELLECLETITGRPALAELQDHLA